MKFTILAPCEIDAFGFDVNSDEFDGNSFI
jgi:hypothetical protein